MVPGGSYRTRVVDPVFWGQSGRGRRPWASCCLVNRGNATLWRGRMPFVQVACWFDFCATFPAWARVAHPSSRLHGGGVPVSLCVLCDLVSGHRVARARNPHPKITVEVMLRSTVDLMQCEQCRAHRVITVHKNATWRRCTSSLTRAVPFQLSTDSVLNSALAFLQTLYCRTCVTSKPWKPRLTLTGL